MDSKNVVIFQMRNIGFKLCSKLNQVTLKSFLHHVFGNLTFHIVQTILLNNLRQICCHFHENRCDFNIVEFGSKQSKYCFDQ